MTLCSQQSLAEAKSLRNHTHVSGWSKQVRAGVTQRSLDCKQRDLSLINSRAWVLRLENKMNSKEPSKKCIYTLKLSVKFANTDIWDWGTLAHRTLVMVIGAGTKQKLHWLFKQQLQQELIYLLACFLSITSALQHTHFKKVTFASLIALLHFCSKTHTA